MSRSQISAAGIRLAELVAAPYLRLTGLRVACMVALGVLAGCGDTAKPTDPAEDPDPVVLPLEYSCGSGVSTRDSRSLAGQLVALNTDEGMRLVDPETGAISSLAGYVFQSWSPDGTLIAAERDGEVSIFDRSLAQALVTVPSPVVSWAPSGDRVGYLDEPDFAVVDLETQASSRYHVCPDQSHIPDDIRKGCTRAEWSRSIDQVLVHSFEHYYGASHLTRLGSGELRTFQPGNWSPSGRFLLLNSGNEYDYNFKVFDVSADADVLLQSAARTAPGEDFDRRWEGDCHLTMVADYEARRSRVTWDVCEGGTPEVLPDGLFKEEAWWSADGGSMAYVTAQDSSAAQDLIVFDAISERATSICSILHATDDREIVLSAYPWSAMGTFLLARVTATAGDSLLLIAADGSSVDVLSPITGEPSWSP